MLIGHNFFIPKTFLSLLHIIQIMKKLFLDDIRYPRDAFLYMHQKIYNDLDWSIVRSFNEFIDFIEKNGIQNIYIISFDHDLADSHYETVSQIDYDQYAEKTGYDCAKWLCDHCLNENVKLPIYYIHSMNPVGKTNIDMYLKNFQKFSNL